MSSGLVEQMKRVLGAQGPKSHREGLLRHSILLFFALNLTMVANIGFTVMLGRALTAEEYSIFLPLMAMVSVLSSPMQAVRTVITHYSARFMLEGRKREVVRLIRRWFTYIAVVALVLLVLVLTQVDWIMEYQKLDDPTPVRIMGFILVVAIFYPILGGAMQGLQAFRWVAAANMTSAGIKLICGCLLVYFVAATASSGLLAHLIGTAATFAVAIFAIRLRLRNAEGEERPLPATTLYFFRSCIVLISFACIMQLPVIYVKHYFSTEVAGEFSYAFTIAKLVIFLPMPVTMALFPKVISEGGMTKEDQKLLIRGLLYAIVLIGGSASVCMLIPQAPLFILTGVTDPEPQLMLMVRLLLLSTIPLGLGHMLMNFELAQHRFAIVPGALITAVAYIAGILIWHETVWQIVAVTAAMSAAFLVMLLVFLPFRADNKQVGPDGD
jgi:O-antigen/teichoic acid export membrane protein